jgi:hypothetical protein
MSPTTAIARSGHEPIPGYVLRQRIGAGGYGEVWSADAPGGLQKAVKLVYGALDQHRASSELRSLQRLRLVRHPFLLSIERIEIIDGQLIIVSELAESSLVEYFHASRRNQLQGIPRDQLLDFLRDAADALDFLSQKHELQHLDVKPGNLLLMADRIKVADFGLVKDLHDPNNSIVSGLTPSHAAPEIFEGRPDRLSDLYSLAIVYQEMLTGKLPFDGKSAGELARQHLHQAPNLEPLPPADRRVVARALAKHPLDRFPSCRAFIDELRRSHNHEKYAIKTHGAPEEAAASSGEASASEDAQASALATLPAMEGSLQILPPLPVAESAEGWQAPFCLFIGLGGIGCRALAALRALMTSKVDSRRQIADHGWLAVDTDFDLLSEVSSDLCQGALDYDSTVLLQLQRPQDYRERNDDRFAAISRRWLYNIPRSLRTEGVRPLALLALLDHYQDLQRRLEGELVKLIANRKNKEGQFSQPLRIYLCSSVHGGTGGALLAEIGLMVRRAMAQLRCEDYVLSAVATLSRTDHGGAGTLAAAAGIACLSELESYMSAEIFVPPVSPAAMGNTASQRPFDWLTLLDGGQFSAPEDECLAINSLSQAMWIDSHTLVGPTLDPARNTQRSAARRDGYSSSHTESIRPWLRAGRLSLVELERSWSPVQLTRLCCLQAFQRWNLCLVGKPLEKPSEPSRGQDPAVPHPTWTRAQSEEVLEHLSTECLSSLRFSVTACAAPAAIPQLQGTWRNRCSQFPDAIRTQLDRDLRSWRAWAGSQLRPRFITWPQLHKVLLRGVEKLLALAEGDDATICEILQQDAAFETAPDASDLRQARLYMRLFAERCLHQITTTGPATEQVSSTLAAWFNSVQAEQNMHSSLGSLDAAAANLPLGWRHMLQRVHAVLDTALQRFAASRCFPHNRLDANEPNGLSPGCITLDHVLRLSTDLITRMMREAGLTHEPKPKERDESSTRTMSLQEMHSLVPSLAQGGGRALRLLAVTPRQFTELQKRDDLVDLLHSCTIVPAQYGEEPCAVCDACDFNLARVIAACWHPSGDTLRLADRLHTRCDVNWPDIDSILRSDHPVPV